MLGIVIVHLFHQRDFPCRGSSAPEVSSSPYISFLSLKQISSGSLHISTGTAHSYLTLSMFKTEFTVCHSPLLASLLLLFSLFSQWYHFCLCPKPGNSELSLPSVVHFQFTWLPNYENAPVQTSSALKPFIIPYGPRTRLLALAHTLLFPPWPG